MGTYKTLAHVLAVGNLDSVNFKEGDGENPSGGSTGRAVVKASISESTILNVSSLTMTIPESAAAH